MLFWICSCCCFEAWSWSIKSSIIEVWVFSFYSRESRRIPYLSIFRWSWSNTLSESCSCCGIFWHYSHVDLTGYIERSEDSIFSSLSCDRSNTFCPFGLGVFIESVCYIYVSYRFMSFLEFSLDEFSILKICDFPSFNENSFMYWGFKWDNNT